MTLHPESNSARLMAVAVMISFRIVFILIEGASVRPREKLRLECDSKIRYMENIVRNAFHAYSCHFCANIAAAARVPAAPASISRRALSDYPREVFPCLRR